MPTPGMLDSALLPHVIHVVASLTHFPTIFLSRTLPHLALHPICPHIYNTPDTHTRRAFDQHGGSFAPVEVHVPVLTQDVTRHAPLSLYHDHGGGPPGGFPRCWKHVQPPGHRSSLPHHGQGACRPELPQWQQRSCRRFRRCACLPHPREPRQAAHDGVQGSPGCGSRESEGQAGYEIPTKPRGRILDVAENVELLANIAQDHHSHTQP